MNDSLDVLTAFYESQRTDLSDRRRSEIDRELRAIAKEVDLQEAGSALKKSLPVAAMMLIGLVRGSVTDAEISSQAASLDSGTLLFATGNQTDFDPSCDV